MKPVMAYYYLTYRCNSKCTYCNFWKMKATEEPSHLQLKDNITALRRIGIKYIDFTGGEPFLYENIQEALDIAKENSLITSITSNGIKYKPVKNLDYLQFSLDYPEERHDRVRGVKCFNKVIESIEIAKKSGQNVGICWTVTNENYTEIENILELCKKYDIVLGINSLYSYFGNDTLTYEHFKTLKPYFKEKDVTADYAALSFVKHNGNHINKPVCKASSSVIVISPDNYYITPCFQYMKSKQKIENNIEELFKKREKFDGTYPFCKGCTMWCYIKPSFLYHPETRYFYLYLYDLIKNYNRRKK